MATLLERLPQNAPGRFYVDSSCIDCDMCRTTAPEFYRRDDEAGVSYVHRQPASPEEIEAAQHGLESCPTESIGNDGAIGAELTPPARG